MVKVSNVSMKKCSYGKTVIFWKNKRISAMDWKHVLCVVTWIQELDKNKLHESMQSC